MPERVTAAEQLSRILYILPAAARDGGVALDELAAALGVTREEVLGDIEEVTAREYYHRAGSGDDLQIGVEHERVTVWTKGEFRRPVRLSPGEALALGLGLRALAAESESARRTELLALAARLEQELAVPVEEEARVRAPAAVFEEPPDVLYRRIPAPPEPEPAPELEPPPEPEPGRLAPRFALSLTADGDADVLSTLADAARERHWCRVVYLKAGAAAPEPRRLAPYVLAYAEGRWYVLGHDADRDDVRAFRLDRVLSVEAEPVAFDEPADFDPAGYTADGRVYRAEQDTEVVFRYSSRIAPWLVERLAAVGASGGAPAYDVTADGSLVVRRRLADTRWAVRHVLGYGPDAEVMEPAELRAAVGAAAASVAG